MLFYHVLKRKSSRIFRTCFLINKAGRRCYNGNIIQRPEDIAMARPGTRAINIMPEQFPEKLSEDQLKWGYWFVLNKMKLKKALILFLVLLDVALVGYGAYGYIDHYILSKERSLLLEDQLSSSSFFPDILRFRQRHRPRDLSIVGVQQLSLGGNDYDLIASISNENKRWYAAFEYRFRGSSYAGKFKQGFILPGETKRLIDLSAKAKGVLKNTELEIENVSWKWISAKDIPDMEAFKKKRLDFLIKDTQFIPAGREVDSVALKDQSKALFSIQNKTAYSYWNVGLHVSLYNGSTLVAVNYISAKDLLSGESRSMEVNWYRAIRAANKIEVAPEVDILDPASYKEAGR